MDLDTENRIAAILMDEARKLRLQAEKEGVGVYLRQPKVRGRPNSRFLTATVLGVQQANKAAEVNEMWKVRKKEIELDDRLRSRSRDKRRDRSDRHHGDISKRSSRFEEDDNYADGFCSSSKRGSDFYSDEDGGLGDEEVEDFLHSRAKRGRGAVGSRMDEPGPYFLPSSSSDSKDKLLMNSDVRASEEWEQRVLGPEKPSFLNPHYPEEDSVPAHDRKKIKKDDAVSSNKKHHSKKRHKPRDKSVNKKKKEKKSKHRHDQRK